MKRSQPESGITDDEIAPKQQKTLVDEEEKNNEEIHHEEDPMNPYIEAFDEIQKELQNLDEQCAREQMMIQKSYDERKKPWFEKRQEIIEKVPGFWCRTFQNHPALFIIYEDVEILQFLKRVDLDDNLDDNGSYTISFVFDEGVKEYMEPTTLVKHVKFENNEEIVVDCTEIKWRENKSPIEIVKERREADKNCRDWSIFEWFTKLSWDDKPDLGEVIRREIWHAPLSYYTDTLSAADNEETDKELDEEYDEDEIYDEDQDADYVDEDEKDA